MRTRRSWRNQDLQATTAQAWYHELAEQAGTWAAVMMQVRTEEVGCNDGYDDARLAAHFGNLALRAEPVSPQEDHPKYYQWPFSIHEPGRCRMDEGHACSCSSPFPMWPQDWEKCRKLFESHSGEAGRPVETPPSCGCVSAETITYGDGSSISWCPRCGKEFPQMKRATPRPAPPRT